jgi:predicted ribosomally synthesized peptide with nif11-like leader
MEKMKELYDKVAKDSALQIKFAEIMKAAEKAGSEETEIKLVAFAKEEGYELTIDEIRDFFSKLEPRKEGTLSEEELDLVAGGKTAPKLHSLSLPGSEGCEIRISGYDGFDIQCLKIIL